MDHDPAEKQLWPEVFIDITLDREYSACINDARRKVKELRRKGWTLKARAQPNQPPVEEGAQVAQQDCLCALTLARGNKTKELSEGAGWETMIFKRVSLSLFGIVTEIALNVKWSNMRLVSAGPPPNGWTLSGKQSLPMSSLYCLGFYSQEALCWYWIGDVATTRVPARLFLNNVDPTFAGIAVTYPDQDPTIRLNIGDVKAAMTTVNQYKKGAPKAAQDAYAKACMTLAIVVSEAMRFNEVREEVQGMCDDPSTSTNIALALLKSWENRGAPLGDP